MRCEGLAYAETHCQKLKTGLIPWSPKLQYARSEFMLAKLQLKRSLKLKVSVSLLCKLAKETKSTTALLPHDICIENVKAASKRYRDLKKCADFERISWMGRLASARGIKYGIKKEQEIQNIIHREEQRRTSRQIRAILKPARQDLTIVGIKDANGNSHLATD